MESITRWITTNDHRSSFDNYCSRRSQNTDQSADWPDSTCSHCRHSSRN